MPVEIDTWLQERERETLEELTHFEQEADARRQALRMLRRWRSDLSKVSPEDMAAAREVAAANGRPKFDQTTDPTGKRRAIWDFLHERRGRWFSPGVVRKSLIQRGTIPADTPAKDIQITMRRMAQADQIEKRGRGEYRLAPLKGPTSHDMLR